MPEQGDIVLIPIPFTDLSSRKLRPVIVISNDEYHRSTRDMVVVAMTSNPAPAPYSLTVTSSDLTRGRLRRPSMVRVDKIFTLAQGLTVKNFGRVNDGALHRIRGLLQQLTA